MIFFLLLFNILALLGQVANYKFNLEIHFKATLIKAILA